MLMIQKNDDCKIQELNDIQANTCCDYFDILQSQYESRFQWNWSCLPFIITISKQTKVSFAVKSTKQVRWLIPLYDLQARVTLYHHSESFIMVQHVYLIFYLKKKNCSVCLLLLPF